jgi:transposase
MGPPVVLLADAADALLQSKAIAIENDLRGTLRNFGLKVGMVGKVKFEARIRELVENLPDLAVLVEPMLIVRRTLREQVGILHRRLLAIVWDDEVCRRLMTTPGVGPVVALTYHATVDVPARFRKSKAVGAVFGLTSARSERQNIALLYEAAQSSYRSYGCAPRPLSCCSLLRRTHHPRATSMTAWAKACGASCGRLCPMPPWMSRCAYLPENFFA